MYSSGKCSEQKKEGFDVARDVLIDVYFTPKKRVKFSSLNLDISRFSQYQESDTSNVFYTDKEEGIQYTIGYNIVSAVKISPIQSQFYLLCRNQIDKGI